MKKPVLIIPLILIIAGLVTFIVINRDKILREESNDHIYISGNIESTEVYVSFQVPGKIDEILCDEGTYVHESDLLARLDTKELKQILTQAKASLNEASVNYDRIKKDYQRASNLFEAGSISEKERDDIKASYDAASARITSLEANLDLAKIRLKYADLCAPSEGFIIVKSAEAGEVVPVGRTIFTLTDLTDVWLTGYIPEKDLGKVKLNQKAFVSTDTYPGKKYSGRISFISQEAEFTPKQIQTQEERTKLVYRIKISLDNTAMELKPGMPADASIVIEENDSYNDSGTHKEI